MQGVSLIASVRCCLSPPDKIGQVVPHEHEEFGKLGCQIFANDHPDRIATHIAACAYNVSEMGCSVRIIVRLLFNPPRFIGPTFLMKRGQPSK